jgi:hypothetical protein
VKPRAEKILPEAKQFAAWAYRSLLQRDAGDCPHPVGVRSINGELALVWPKKRVPTANRPRLTHGESFHRYKKLERMAVAFAKELDELLERGDLSGNRKDGLQGILEFGGLHHVLESAALNLITQLLRLAQMKDARAVRNVAVCGVRAANGLQDLSRSDLALVRRVAQTFPFWPVLYSPHKDARAELKEMIDKLGVGTGSPERMRGKWSNKPATKQAHRAVVGTYANRIGYTLLRIKMNGNLGLLLHLHPQGWPAWIVRLAKLPQLTRHSAPDWFAVGWEALTAAAGGRVSNIEKLRPVGESAAAYRKLREDSPRVQEQLREKQIRARLCEAFIARFGS